MEWARGRRFRFRPEADLSYKSEYAPLIIGA
jgi:hypothetical protein